MSDVELRVYALERAIWIEGAKAITDEVLEAAQRIYEFLTDQEAAPGRVN